jgi:phosphoribosylanthranilate isomerase
VLAALRGEGPWALWKAVRAGSLADLERAVDRFAGLADALLVEGWKEGVLGGGGARLDLDPGRVRALIPSGLGFVLAGGLEPQSVGAAVRSFRPDAVDVSSGVERAVGAKDPGLVYAFVREARAAAAASEADRSGASVSSATRLDPRASGRGVR